MKLMNNLNESLKKLYKRLIYQTVGIIMFIIAIVLTIHWYNWKLLLIILLFSLANNISMKY